MPTAQTDFQNRIPERLKTLGADANRGLRVVFSVEGEGGGVWTVFLDEAPRVVEDAVADPSCRLDMDASAWSELSEDPKRALPLFFSKRLRVTGNPAHAMAVQQILS